MSFAYNTGTSELIITFKEPGSLTEESIRSWIEQEPEKTLKICFPRDKVAATE